MRPRCLCAASVTRSSRWRQTLRSTWKCTPRPAMPALRVERSSTTSSRCKLTSTCTMERLLSTALSVEKNSATLPIWRNTKGCTRERSLISAATVTSPSLIGALCGSTSEGTRWSQQVPSKSSVLAAIGVSSRRRRSSSMPHFWGALHMLYVVAFLSRSHKYENPSAMNMDICINEWSIIINVQLWKPARQEVSRKAKHDWPRLSPTMDRQVIQRSNNTRWDTSIWVYVSRSAFLVNKRSHNYWYIQPYSWSPQLLYVYVVANVQIQLMYTLARQVANAH